MRNIAQRHKTILNELEKDGYVKVHELSELLGVSEVTIRKDLKELERRKLLYRSHGSASQLSSLINDRPIDEKAKVRVEEKQRISEAANKLLQKNDRIIIASGTTLLNFAQKITVEPLTVITSSVKISLTLYFNPNIEVIQLGGSMRKSSASVIGPHAEGLLSELMCNKLFIGVDGIDMDFGLTTSDIGEAHLNQYMLEAAQEVIVLADSSKFGKRGFGKICNFDQINRIITDREAPVKMVKLIKEMGIEVDLV